MLSLLFLVSLAKIVFIDILLSGDNAVVIAMACRGLDPKQRLLGMIFGAAAAVFMRVWLTGIFALVVAIPYLRIGGAFALVWVAVKMLRESDGDGKGKQADSLLAAVVLIVIADLSMSIDNVLAIGAAARGDVALLALGLALSIPLVVAGAAIITKFVDRYPVLVWAGAALLGWIAGEVVASDPFVLSFKPFLAVPNDFAAPVGALGVLAAGAALRLIDKRNKVTT